jgi:hypothetical protein
MREKFGQPKVYGMNASSTGYGSNTALPADLERLGVLLDSEFRLPLGIRFGWDGLIGLIPFFGGLLTTGVSGYIILRAAGAGVSSPVLARMVVNVMIDNGIAAIPFFGWLGDFAWKSNLKNLELLRLDRGDPRKTARRSVWILGVLIAALIGIAVGFAVLAGAATWALVEWMKTLSI